MSQLSRIFSAIESPRNRIFSIIPCLHRFLSQPSSWLLLTYAAEHGQFESIDDGVKTHRKIDSRSQTMKNE